MTKRELVYMQNQKFKENSPTLVPTVHKLYKLQSNDVLSIKVLSLQPEMSELFNITNPTNAFGVADQGSMYLSGYSVDEEGNIELPTLGKLKVSGLRRQFRTGREGRTRRHQEGRLRRHGIHHRPGDRAERQGRPHRECRRQGLDRAVGRSLSPRHADGFRDEQDALRLYLREPEPDLRMRLRRIRRAEAGGSRGTCQAA